jgi:hypothetical protein
LIFATQGFATPVEKLENNQAARKIQRWSQCMVEPADLEARSIPIGDHYLGALMIRGDEWPRDVPIWTCSHRHIDPQSAQECAREELQRRSENA